MRLTIIAVLLISCVVGQDNTNLLRIIPSANRAKVGEQRFISKDDVHYVGLGAPDSVSNSLLFRLPATDGDAGDSITTDGAQNLRFGPSGGAAGIRVSPTNPLYLYAHFRDDDKTHLYLSYSNDALNFKPVKKDGSLATTENRDPSVTYFNGLFRFITSPTPQVPCKIQYWESADLKTFTGPILLDMGPSQAGCVGAWAPEWFVDPVSSRFGFFTSLTSDYANTFTPYFVDVDPTTHALTATAITLSGTAQSRVFDFFNYYDTAAAQYYLFYVDEQQTGSGPYYQKIAYATSTTLTGTYTQQTPATAAGSTDTFGFSDTSEAPIVMPLPNGCIRVYADTWVNMFNAFGNVPRKYLVQYVDSCSTVGSPFSTIGGSGAAATVTSLNNGNLTGLSISAAGTNFTSDPYVTVTPVGADPGNGAQVNAYARNGGVVELEIADEGRGYAVAPTLSIASGPRPIHIGKAEHGTIMAITDPAIANIVYQAAELGRNNYGDAGRVVFGDTTEPSIYTVTARSKGAHFFLAHAESPTFAAESADRVAATWSGCGNEQYSCPPPEGGFGKWIDAYRGVGNSIQLNNTNTDTGETSLFLSNGIYRYGLFPATASASGDGAMWTLGTNNQYFGANPGASTANNWFFLYNRGLGATLDPARTVSNPGFESGTSSWTGVGSVTFSSSAVAVHGGTLSLLESAGDGEVAINVTGLTAGTTYTVSSYLWTDQFGIGKAAGYMWVHDASSAGPNYVNFSATGTPVNLGLSGGIGEWRKISLNYTANSTGVVQVMLGRTTGTGNVYWDDVSVVTQRIGSFPLGVSPETGEVRANYGITLGRGDLSSLDHFASANIDTYGKGFINVGDGDLGKHNALIRTGSAELADYLFVSGNSHPQSIVVNGQGTSGEAGILIGNGIDPATFSDAVPTATGAMWKIGENNPCFGSGGCTNTNNGWFYAYSFGLGGFPLGISPAGIVHINYELGLGLGSGLSQTDSIRLGSGSPNVLSISDGVGGDRNGIVLAGVLDAKTVYRLNGTDVASMVGGAPTWTGGVSTTTFGIGGNFFAVYNSGWHTGSSGNPTCDTVTLQYVDWAGANQSSAVCWRMTINQFYGGIFAP